MTAPALSCSDVARLVTAMVQACDASGRQSASWFAWGKSDSTRPRPAVFIPPSCCCVAYVFARTARRIGGGGLAMSVALETGRNRIMDGPKPDGTHEPS
jgi:hypothetical protein